MWVGSDIIELLKAGICVYKKTHEEYPCVIAMHPDVLSEVIRRILEHRFTPIQKPTFNGIDLLDSSIIPVDEIRFY